MVNNLFILHNGEKLIYRESKVGAMLIIVSFFNECGVPKSGLTAKKKKIASQNSMVNTNDIRYGKNIDANKISKVTYNVKKSQECAEMIKVKVESKDEKEIGFKKLVRKKTKKNYLNIAF